MTPVSGHAEGAQPGGGRGGEQHDGERGRIGLTLTELARRAGIAKSTVSQLEAATGNPSVETLWALATALGVPFNRLVDPPVSPVRVIRAGQGTAIPSDTARFTGTLEWHLLVQLVLATPDRRAAAGEVISRLGADMTIDEALETPFLLIGTAEQMAEQLLATRERYGFSYVTVHDPYQRAFEPVIEWLR